MPKGKQASGTQKRQSSPTDSSVAKGIKWIWGVVLGLIAIATFVYYVNDRAKTSSAPATATTAPVIGSGPGVAGVATFTPAQAGTTPTEQPTTAPTDQPTAAPTEQPTAVPTDEPVVVSYPSSGEVPVITRPIKICDDDFVTGSGSCWKGTLGAQVKRAEPGHDNPWAISFSSDATQRGDQKFSVLSQEVGGLEEGAELILMAWVKDEVGSGAKFRIRTYDTLDWKTSQVHTVEGPVGKDWTPVFVRYKVNQSKKLKFILETDGTSPVIIGGVELGQ